MDTGHYLFGILGVHFIFGLAIFFGDGEDAERFEGFEGDSGSWVEHANANVQIVAAIKQRDKQYDAEQHSLCENGCRGQDKIGAADGIVSRLLKKTKEKPVSSEVYCHLVISNVRRNL